MSNTNSTKFQNSHKKIILQLEGISKSFPGVQALDNVSLEVRKGEILAILGENGAGKSTLMKILSGLYQPDTGSIYANLDWFIGSSEDRLSEIQIKGTREGMRLGIGMVYQHFQLVEPFTVTENITLGAEYTYGPTILMNNGKAEYQIELLSKEYGLPIKPDDIVENLPVGLKQRVEILKQLYRNADLLILDEPTAVLTPTEVEGLFRTMRNFRNAGKSIIFITHKLREPLAIADRIVVLRKGKYIGETDPKNATKELLAEMVVGKRVIQQNERAITKAFREILSISNLTIKDHLSDQIVVKDVTFTVHEGEIVGIAGVQGNGQSELIEGIMKLRKIESGNIIFYKYPNNGIGNYDLMEEIDFTELKTIDILKEGIAYIPEDRVQRGLVLDFTVSENIWLGFHGQRDTKINQIKKDIGYQEPYPSINQIVEEEIISDKRVVRLILRVNRFIRRLWQKLKNIYTKFKKIISLPFKFIEKLSNSIIEKYSVVTSSSDSIMKNLSGGNQQKVIIGREFTKHPNLVIASEPTRGVDIGVMTQVHEEIIAKRNDGAAILLVSSDLDEILALADTVIVMYEGEIVGYKKLEEFDTKAISQLMTSGRMEENL